MLASDSSRPQSSFCLRVLPRARIRPQPEPLKFTLVFSDTLKRASLVRSFGNAKTPPRYPRNSLDMPDILPRDTTSPDHLLNLLPMPCSCTHPVVNDHIFALQSALRSARSHIRRLEDDVARNYSDVQRRSRTLSAAIDSVAQASQTNPVTLPAQEDWLELMDKAQDLEDGSDNHTRSLDRIAECVAVTEVHLQHNQDAVAGLASKISILSRTTMQALAAVHLVPGRASALKRSHSADSLCPKRSRF